MKKKVLIVYAQPEPSSLTRHLVDQGIEVLRKQGHDVLISDLYAMKWKAVLDANDFPERADVRRLSFIDESRHAYKNGLQTPDVVVVQNKLLAGDAVILKFPLWWFSMPAIMKGWVERVYAYNFAYGYRDAGNAFRYGNGILKRKRAMLSVMCGGPVEDYSPRGINGPLDELLFPITHGILFYPGMDVLPILRSTARGALMRPVLPWPRKAGANAWSGCSKTSPSPSAARTAATFPIGMSWRIISRRQGPGSPLTSRSDDRPPGRLAIDALAAALARFMV